MSSLLGDDFLKRVGLFDAKRRLGLEVRSRGWLPWRHLVNAPAFETCCESLLRNLDGGGDYVEFGVSRGTSLAAMSRALRKTGRESARLIGFDSFEGMPAGSEAEGWSPGEFKSTLPATRAYLESQGVDMTRVELVKGWFDDTLNAETAQRLKLNNVAVIMFDCDIYSATRRALDFIAPFVAPRAAFLFDDWGWREDGGERGQKEAFAEFLEANPNLQATPAPSYDKAARVFLLSQRSD